MKKAAFWSVLLVVAGVFIWIITSGVWGLRQGHWETEIHWRGWQGKAAGDGYYLAKQLLRHRQNHLTTGKKLQEPWALPKDGVLILTTGNKAAVSEQQLNRLKRWINQGGTLLAGLNNPVVQALGVSDDTTSDSDTPVTDDSRESHAIYWTAPGESLPLNPSLPLSAAKCGALATAGHEETGRLSNTQGCAYLQRFRFGKGQLVVWHQGVERIWHDSYGAMWGKPADEENIPILTAGHAALLHTLVGENKHVLWPKMLAQPSTELSFIRWLMPLLVLLLLWFALLWRFGSRFGSLLEPEPTLQYGDLRSHFNAAGNFIYTAGGEKVLLAASRQRLFSQLPADYQAVIKVPDALAEALQRDYGIPPGQTQRAFFYTAEDFVRLMADIEIVRRILERGK